MFDGGSGRDLDAQAELAEFHTLVEDIRKHGLLEPITRHEGQILDGRNRYRASLEAGITPHFQDWQGEGGTPAEFVWSRNAERRQLTASQRAMAAQALMPFLERKAKERQQDHGGTAPGRGRETLSPNLEQVFDRPPTPGNPGRAAEHAAKLAGVSHSLIYEAKRLSQAAETDPRAAELAQQVKQGELSVYRAAQLAGIAIPSRSEEGRQRAQRHDPACETPTPPSTRYSPCSKRSGPRSKPG